VQSCVAVVACTLWVALALPGLQLLPGLGNDGDASVAISLQSALLGIDDMSAEPADAQLRASLRALGIDPAHGSLSAALSRTQSAATFAPLVAQVDTSATPPTDVSTATGPPPTPPVAPHVTQLVARTHTPAPPRVVPVPRVPVPPVRPPVTTPPVTMPPAPPPPAAPTGQTIVFTSTPPAAATVGGPVYIVAATASSGLAVVFTADPSSAGVCTVAGSVVTPVGVGTCMIDADQPGNASRLAAPRVRQSFAVGSGVASLSVQSISFTSLPPPAPVVGAAPYVLAAAASSGLPVTYSTSAGSAGACTLAGDLVTFVGSGTCRIFADQPGNGAYLPAPQAQQLVVVSRVTQTIIFTSTPPGSTTVGDPAYVVAATASSGLPVVFSAAGSSAAVCTVSGSSVVAVGAGTCVIEANQFGDATYRPALVQQSFAVGAGAPSQSVQTIQFTSTPPAGAVAGGAAYTVAAAASSGLAVAFSADSSSAGVCSVSGGTVAFVGAGTCTIDADQTGNASYLAAPQAQQSFAVSLVAQAISFGSAPPSGALVGDPAYVVSATASSGLAVTFTADAASAGVCTVSGTTVSLIGAGTCIVDGDQAGNGAYQAAPRVQQSFSIATPSLSVQSINFTSTPPSGAVVGGATYAISATASSGLPVAFSVAPASAGICTLSGNTVSFTGAGTCTIEADQAGGASYQAAPTVQQSLSVSLVPQTISFSSSPPVGAVVGDPAYTVTATASSGLAVTFTAAAGSAGVCTVTGATVSFTGTGTCTIDASQPGNGTHQPAVQVHQSFTVSTPSASSQTISFTSSPPGGATVGGATYGVSATASSGLAVTFSVAAGSAGVCTVSGATVSFVGTGTCVIHADQAGDASYLAAAQAQQSFTVGLTQQTISFSSTPPVGAIAGDPDYVVAATATSGLPVTFTADASSAGICTVSGSSVSLIGTGLCIVNANQAGDASHQSAPQAQQSFSVGGAPTPSVQSVTFTSAAPSGAVVGGATYMVTAAASSGLAVVFSADAGSAGVCTIVGSTVSMIGSGTCTIDANQPGDASYQAAPQMQQSFAVGLVPQTISFTSSPPGGATVGGATYGVSATASSGLAVTFTIAAASAGVCTLSGSTVSFVGAGTCTIRADQAGNGTYQAAPQVQQSLTVTSPPPSSTQSISFTSTPPAAANVGGVGYTVSASASSGLPVTFSIDASSAGVCTISGSTVSFVGTGTCTIDANQPGNGSYQAAPQAQQSFAVGLASQAISFTSSPPGGATVGGSTYTVLATASSGLAVTFSIAPASAGICSLAGSVVSFTGTGTCTVRANQGGNGSYQAAPQAQQSFTVTNPAPSQSVQTIQFTSTAPSGAVVGGSSYTVTATASSGLAVTFTRAAASAGVCNLAGSTVTLVGAGTCTINANQGGNANYQAAPQAQQSFTISLRSQSIAFTSSPPGSAHVGDSPYTVSATASSGLPVTFAGSAGVCSVSGSTVSIVGAGTCVITASQPGNGTYQAAPQAQQSFTVSRGSQTIVFTSTPPNADRYDPPYTVTATAGSGLAVIFTVDPSSAGVCSVSGSTVSFSGRGTCIVYANQPGDANWLPAPQVQQVFQVKNHTPG
jgi:hypothetical protein